MTRVEVFVAQEPKPEEIRGIKSWDSSTFLVIKAQYSYTFIEDN